MSFAEHMGDARVLRRRAEERQTDAWHRELGDGRIEVMCKAPGFRIRVSAPDEQAWRFVELFEEVTGLVVRSDRRPRRRVAQIRGQLSMVELESGDSKEEDHDHG